MNLDINDERPGLGTGKVPISIFPFPKMEQFVQHISHKTWVEPMAIHHTNAFQLQNYFRILLLRHLWTCYL